MDASQINTTLAPFSQEAEEATIGAVLISGSLYADLAAFLTANDFYLTRHAHLWRAFEQLEKDKLVIDLMTVCETLRTSGKLDDIGGPAYLLQLVNSTPNSMHAEAYARLVQRTATRRKLLMATDKIRASAMDEGKNIDTVIAESEAAIFEAGNRHIERKGEWIDKPAERVWDAMLRLYKGKDSGTVIQTGFDNIDGILNGLDVEQLIILAARPGMGKTSLLLCIMLNLAKRGIPVGMFTMEMSTESLVRRFYSLLSGVNANKMRVAGGLTTDEVNRLRAAYEAFGELPIYITDEPSPTPRQVMTIAQRLVRSDGAKAIFIDGIYRMSPDYDTKGDETAAYSQIAKALKTMARALRVPVMATHQLNRSLESRADKRPVLSDLRQSGRIEEEADVGMFLYRDIVYNSAADPHLTELIVAKQREGSVGTVPLHFEPTLTKFIDADIERVSLGD